MRSGKAVWLRETNRPLFVQQQLSLHRSSTVWMELGKLLTLSALLFASAFGKRESDNVLLAPIPNFGEYDQQTPDKCLHIIFYTSRCSIPSLQKLVDSMSTCGTKGKESIRSFEMSCRQNAQGEYCGELSMAMPELEVGCSSDCSVECYDLLNRLNSSIGCCLEFFIFSNPYGILPKSFKLCDLPIPSPCHLLTSRFLKSQFKISPAIQMMTST